MTEHLTLVEPTAVQLAVETESKTLAKNATVKLTAVPLAALLSKSTDLLCHQELVGTFHKLGFGEHVQTTLALAPFNHPSVCHHTAQ